MTKIYVAGHRGMVGSSIIRLLEAKGFHNLVVRNKDQLDLKDQASVRSFLMSEKPDQIYLAAAKVGGIHANNTYPADFLYENIMIQSNVINEAFHAGVNKLLFLGSSCIYPRVAPQPIREEYLLSGSLEPTNESYAIAKIAGIKLCESYSRQYGVDYRSVMPTNLYGPNDNYHLTNSHVIPALIRRIHEAKLNNDPTVVVWGTGLPKREFLYVDDLARASFFVMNLDRLEYRAITKSWGGHLNVGYGEDISISDLALILADVIEYKGGIEFDISKPDGTPRKILDSTRVNKLGWAPSTKLRDGLKMTYDNFLMNSKIRRK